MAWSFVGVSSVVQVTAATHTLVTTGITGLQDGDLLIACIASRIASTTSITLPVSGEWTLVAEQKTNNVLATTSGIASAMMAYHVYRAGAPNMTFTHPTAPSVALGHIVAYRGEQTASPQDTQTGFTTALTTAVSGTGLTTSQADDLIVAMVAGGQEAAWSSFNATSPSGASGATSAAAPTTAWLERVDSNTTTGADTSLAIFDAIKSAAGATGNLTATASIQGGNAVIAGAFKISPASVADAWNVNDKNVGATLSGGDKIATWPATNSLAGVRSTTTHVNGTAGKYYAEIKVNQKAAGVGHAWLGFKKTTDDLQNTTVGWLWKGQFGEIWIDNTYYVAPGVFATGDVCCLAWDAGAKLLWFRLNGGNWNGSGSADPSTGAGGVPATNDAASYALYLRGVWASDQWTVRTEAAEYTQTPPAGFTSWMGESLGGAAITMPAALGTITLAGLATGLRAARRLTADTGAVTLAGVATGLRKGYSLTAASGAVTVTRYDAGLTPRHFYTLPIVKGQVTVTFNDAGLGALSSYTLAANAGAVALSGQSAALRHAGVMSATTGAVLLSGQAATLRYGHVLTATVGAVALSGKDVALRHAARMSAAQGVVTLTSNAAALNLSRKITMPAATGAVALEGVPVGLIPTGADDILLATVGDVTLAGQAAALRYGHKLNAAAGAVALSGQAATLRYGHVGAAAKGTVTLAGPVTSLRYGHALLATQGAVTVTFNDATFRLRRAYAMIAAPGGIVVSGYPAALNTASNKTMVAAPGAVAVTGKTAALRALRILPITTSSIVVSGAVADLLVDIRVDYTLAAEPSETIRLRGVAADLQHGNRQPGRLSFGRPVILLPGHW